MNIQVHGKASGGFTIAEVSMAVGIVAFGLVAVFSILPFGLTAQKDNREETIIRYEAQYWFAALRAGGLRLKEIKDRVERVELTDANGFDYSIPLDEDSVRGWSGDVCDWLSAPDEEVGTKFAHVWAFNGSLFDRLNSPGEFSFSYFMDANMTLIGDSGSLITLTFHWPITGPIKDALRSSSSINDIVKGSVAGLTAPAKSKSFSIRTSLRPKPMEYKAIGDLDNRQKQFLRAGLPGEEVSIGDLEGFFETKVGEADKELKFTRLGSGGVDTIATVEASGDSEAFSDKDIGRYIRIMNSGVLKTYPIINVRPILDDNDVVIKHKIKLDFLGKPPIFPPPDKSFPYRVTFLDKHPPHPEPGETWEDARWVAYLNDYPKALKEPETWPKFLKDCMEDGLVAFDSGKWTFRSISSSRVNGLTPSILK